MGGRGVGVGGILLRKVTNVVAIKQGGLDYQHYFSFSFQIQRMGLSTLLFIQLPGLKWNCVQLSIKCIRQ